jgi:HK97 family phage major capsid protein
MMSIQALREQRGKIAHALQELVNKTDWSETDDQPKYDAAMAEIDQIDAKIKRQQEANAKLAEETRTNTLSDAAARIGRDKGNTNLSVYSKWIKGGDAALSADDWATIRNTMSTTTGSQGGFTVDTEVARTVVNALKEFGGMRQVSTVISTSGFGLLSYPTSNGTSEVGAIVAQNAEVARANPTFGTVGIPAYKYSSNDVAVPIELLQDSGIDIEAFVNARLVERLGRITNQHFTTGTGTDEPNGIVTGATIGLTAANSTSQVTAITYDSLVALQHSVDRAYRQSAGWMFNDNTLMRLRQMKDGSGRPIFVPGYETGNPAGAPDRLLGDPITVNQDMANMAANARSILYGDFTGYVIRDVMAVEMYRFTDSAFARFGQVGFLALMRTGGNLVDASKVRVFVNAAS